MAETNVKRIFFNENSVAPSFELENGDVKIPFSLGTQLLWMTVEELEKAKQDLVEKSKPKSDIKIVKS